MAQTKRKRRSKHRGTPAGTIEARGRTSRPLPADQKKKQERAQARENRLNRRPTWKNSLTRASFAAVLLFAFLLLTTKSKNKVEIAFLFTAIALLIYVPAGYYIELVLWRRRQKKNAAAGVKR